MFTADKSFSAFDGPKKPLTFVGVNSMLDILSVCKQLQVFQSIVGAVKVFVVNFKASWNRAIKRFPHHAVDATTGVHTIFAQTGDEVMLEACKFYRPVRRVAPPHQTSLDVAGGSQTGVQKLRNFAQQRAALKHLLGFCYSSAIQRLSSCCATDVSVVANFVQRLKPEHRFPRFHAAAPLMFNSIKCSTH